MVEHCILNNEAVTEKDPMGPSWNRHLSILPLICRRTLASQAFPKFQRVNLIREERKCRKKGKLSSEIK